MRNTIIVFCFWNIYAACYTGVPVGVLADIFGERTSSFSVWTIVLQDKSEVVFFIFLMLTSNIFELEFLKCILILLLKRLKNFLSRQLLKKLKFCF